jgi:hypothetical protein
MANARCTEEQFVTLLTKHGPQKTADLLGIAVRKVYERRRNIERRRGQAICVPNRPISDRVKEIGLGAQDWSVAWDKTDGLSVLVHNPDFTPDDYHTALQESVEAVRKLAPKFPTIKHTRPKDGHCLVMNFTDLHFGGWGLEKAQATVTRALNDAIARSSGYDIEKIIFVMGSDCLHTDTGLYTTTKGTQQVTDGSTWSQAFKAAQASYTHCLASLAPIAPVHCVHVSGNHDELMSYALAQVIEATFSKAKNITFDVDDTPRKYVQFGSSLLAFTHGDKVKDADIPHIVSHEAASMWGKTLHRYVYMGHLHHNRQVKYQAVKEHPGITLQWLRSPKPTDKWHRDNGYLGGQGVTSFIHSREGGQVASLSVNL